MCYGHERVIKGSALAMREVRVSEILHDLLERHVKKTEYESVEAAVDVILKSYLMKHDTIGNMHQPFSTILMSSVDDIRAARKLLETVNWMSLQKDINKTIEKVKDIEQNLSQHAYALNEENK